MTDLNKQWEAEARLEEQLEANAILIAEFLGAKLNSYGHYDMTHLVPTIQNPAPYAEQFFSPDEMRFHNDWNWLMAVVERIEATKTNNETGFMHGVAIEFHGCYINSIGVEMAGFDTKIEATYHAVIAFIEWYNTIS